MFLNAEAILVVLVELKVAVQVLPVLPGRSQYCPGVYVRARLVRERLCMTLSVVQVVVVQRVFLVAEPVRICRLALMLADVRFARIHVPVIRVAVWEPVNICRSERTLVDVRFVGIPVEAVVTRAVEKNIFRRLNGVKVGLEPEQGVPEAVVEIRAVA